VTRWAGLSGPRAALLANRPRLSNARLGTGLATFAGQCVGEQLPNGLRLRGLRIVVALDPIRDGAFEVGVKADGYWPIDMVVLGNATWVSTPEP
jgi:hypothetical protein